MVEEEVVDRLVAKVDNMGHLLELEEEDSYRDHKDYKVVEEEEVGVDWGHNTALLVHKDLGYYIEV